MSEHPYEVYVKTALDYVSDGGPDVTEREQILADEVVRLTALAERAAELERERDEWKERANFADAYKYRQRAERAEEALRPFAEKWDLHAADYIVLEGDSRELRILEAHVVAEMIEDVRAARAALPRQEAHDE